MAASDRITLRLCVPYSTRWGQTVKAVGTGQSFGDEDVARATALVCTRHGDLLMWAGEVLVARASAYTYKYVVVGEDGGVEDEEISDRCLRLPGLLSGAVVDVHDEWQVPAPLCTPLAAALHPQTHAPPHCCYCTQIYGMEGGGSVLRDMLVSSLNLFLARGRAFQK